MKTIKELEAEIGRWKPSAKYSGDSQENVKVLKARIKQLKEVLGLIDELSMEAKGWNISAEELKAKIQGE